MPNSKNTKREHENTSTYYYANRSDPSEVIAIIYFDGRESDDVIIERGVEYELIDTPVFDLDAMPKHARDAFIKATYEAFKRFMERPDAQSILDATKERLIQEGSTLLNPRKSSHVFTPKCTP